MIESAAIQLSLDMNCNVSDFLNPNGCAVISQELVGRRRFPFDPNAFKAVTFGHGTVISVPNHLYNFSEALLQTIPGTELFDAKGVYTINKELKKYGHAIASFNQYYLPSPSFRLIPSDGFNLQIHSKMQIPKLYEFSQCKNALMFSSKNNREDVLAVSAFSGSQLMGIAGASNDSDHFWQIGIDVLPPFRQKGLGRRLVSLLTREILSAGAVPYYGTWWSNLASQKLALSCGYFPAWTEMQSVAVN